MPDYYVHSGVRKRHTRLKRMQAAQHPALVQHIGGLIVRRSRPVRISETKLAEILPQLHAAHADGRLELRTADGRLVDLKTLAPLSPPETSKPLPNPPLDSAANDKPAGAPMPAYYEGQGQDAAVTTPAIVAETVDDLTGSDEDGTQPDGDAAASDSVDTASADSEQDVETDPDAAEPVVSPATGEAIGPTNPETPALLRNRREAP